MQDKYYGEGIRLADPSNESAVVVPSDSQDIAIPKGLYVGVGGDIAMIGEDDTGEARVWKNVVSGSILPFRPKRIYATGTTATNILALY